MVSELSPVATPSAKCEPHEFGHYYFDSKTQEFGRSCKTCHHFEFTPEPDDYDDEDLDGDEEDDDDDEYWLQNCGSTDGTGNWCTLAGTEDCEFDCPLRK